MINDKKSFFLGNLLGAGVVGMIVVACGSGGGDANTGVSGGANSVSARQVIFTDSSGNYIAYEKGRFVKVATTPGYIDTTTQVLARNVNLDTSNNTVTQPNLQDALDKQIALDLTKTLPGTTWVITNTGTPEYTYPNDPGNVTFNSDGSFTLNSGWFCAAGARTYSSASSYYPPVNLPYMTSGPRTFKVIGENTVTFTYKWKDMSMSSSSTPDHIAFSVTAVVSKSTQHLTFVAGQCVSELAPASST